MHAPPLSWVTLTHTIPVPQICTKPPGHLGNRSPWADNACALLSLSMNSSLKPSVADQSVGHGPLERSLGHSGKVTSSLWFLIMLVNLEGNVVRPISSLNSHQDSHALSATGLNIYTRH
jgi:hypothetical protein